MREQFWHRPLKELTGDEWEALCDGCGKCCLNKLEDEDTGEVALTRVACRLFDDSTCQCAKYKTRHDYVPECIVLTADSIDEHMYWLPKTCAYRLRHLGEALPQWHPLLTQNPDSPHSAQQSMQGRTVSEAAISDEDWEDHIIEEPC